MSAKTECFCASVKHSYVGRAAHFVFIIVVGLEFNSHLCCTFLCFLYVLQSTAATSVGFGSFTQHHSINTTTKIEGQGWTPRGGEAGRNMGRRGKKTEKSRVMNADCNIV